MNKFLKNLTILLACSTFLYADAIYVDGNITENIQDVDFLNHDADNGGAIYVYGSFLGNISNSGFTNNHANNYGGAIAVANRFSGTISNSRFASNSVSGDMFGGGAILSAIFSGNITNSLFSDNRAYNGGSIYAEEFYGTIKDTNFTNNVARNRGGGIYIHGSMNMTLHSTNHMIFMGNRDSSGSNAIYYNGYGGYDDGILNIITENGSIMEFRDAISDYGEDENGKLFVEKNGNGTLIYSTAMTYRGSTDINEGTLLLKNAGNVTGIVNIADNATLSIDKTANEYTLGSNVNIHGGTLDINLNDINRLFSFANRTMQQNFIGTLNLTNAFYYLLQDNNYKIALNSNSRAILNQNNATIKNISLNGGLLDLSYTIRDMNIAPILRIDNFIIENDSVINFYTDFRNYETNLTNNQNLYDIASSNQTLYQIINATNGIQGDKSKVELINVSLYNYIISNIIQNGIKAGEAFVDVAGTLEDNGAYAKLGNVTKIKSLTNVIFDSNDVSNDRLDVIFTGNGNFTFDGNHSVFIGNNASDYTGATFLVNSANVTAISNNTFGKTNYLVLENSTIFDLNSYSQTVNGKLENNGSIYFTNNATLSIQGGHSFGDNSLSGDGILIVNGDFLVDGSNTNLHSTIVLNNGTTTVKQTDSFGTIENLTFNGGGLNLEAFTISAPFEPVLTANNINIGNGGGIITVNSDLTHLANNVTYGLNFYDYGELHNAYKIIGSINEISGAKTQLNITNIAGQTSTDIIQSNDIVGKAVFGNVASIQNDGIYIGFGLREIVSFSNVEFNTSGASNNILNAVLSGSGNMTFSGNDGVYMGNIASNYTGSTSLKNGANMTAISNNIFGNTNHLMLENSTILNLNSYSQIIYGKLHNNGTIDFGDYAFLEFNGGHSLGNNSLRGYGNIVINGDFNIEGENNNLNLYASINNGITTMSSANSLGKYGYISLERDASLVINSDVDEIFMNYIDGYYNTSLVKIGNGSLRLDEYINVGLLNIVEGSLVMDIGNFYGDINIDSNANLIFDNSWNSGFYNQFSGNGSVAQFGDYTLSIYENNPYFTGSYIIHEGILRAHSFDSLSNADSITIARNAAYRIESDKNENLSNKIIGEGTLYVDLSDEDNNLTLINTNVFQNFNGSIELSNARYNLFADNNYSLVLNHGSSAIVNESNSTLKDLTFDGGALNLNINTIPLPLQIMLSVENLNINGNGGSVIIEADLNSLVSDINQNSNLYDYGLSINKQKIVNVTNNVTGIGTQISIDGLGNEDFAYENITQDNDIVGKAVFGVIATTENDGIYLGFGLEEIESFENKTIELNSSSATNFILNAKLTGDGGFDFNGNNPTFIGNAINNYTGTTSLKRDANITALSHNAFGYTNLLSLEYGTVFNLGAYHQFVNGGLNNNATININNGQLVIDGSTINNGAINLNDYSEVYFIGGGISTGNDTLSGGGWIEFYDDFEIKGINKNLTADTYVGDAVLKLSNAASLGDNGTIYLGYDSSAINIDITDDETINKGIYGQGKLIKDGNGSLRINTPFDFTVITMADIVNGTLIIDASKFYGDVNISQDANLVIDNTQDTIFYNELKGNGNITQLGNRLFVINSNNPFFNGVYTVDGSTLIIGSDSYNTDASLGGNVEANNALLHTFGNVDGNISLNNSSWQLNRDFHTKTLTLTNNSNVFINNAANFMSLEIDNLEGDSGNFYQRIQLQQFGNNVVNNGDLLIINNSSRGDHVIHFNDNNSGKLTAPYEENILIVKQNNPNGNYEANFTGAIDLGANTYTLTKSDTNNSFYLKSNGCASYACASLSFPNINYILNYITAETLIQRMGEVDIKRAEKDDIWVKTYFGESNSFESYFDIDKIKYYGFTLGADRMYETDINNIFFGFTVGFNEAYTEYKTGDADSRHYSAGIYGTFKYDDGFYIDILTKYQKNKNSFNTKTSNGFIVDGDGNSDGVLISVESGKRYALGKYFIEPQIQSSYFHHNGFIINSSNGLKTQIDSFESIRTRIGTLLGYKLQQQTDIYLKAGYMKEFKGSYEYSFNDSEKQTYTVNWSFFDSALGIILNHKNNHFYLEGTYQDGNAFKNIKLNAGYRYEF
ncbi:MAG: autotransporter outer membrane beta-barrel domain-containing protein [Campylobacteraceae bacterium]|jgi:outer membrane autotransporter protein|nr:autotransporter outer membrane beta-barrel domain-containing protein [Campylobacteraceae bacterium]